MPYVLNPDDEDKNKVPGTDSAGLGGEGGENMPSPQQSGLSGWTDVKAYLDANKDQSLGLAQNLSNKLGGEADTLKTNIDEGEKEFEGIVDKNKVDFDQGLVDTALADPDAFVKDDANVEKFTKMRDANYEGPTDLSGVGKFGELQAKIKQGAGRAALIDTEGGRQSLLFEGEGNPTKGQVTLDSLLIAGSPESRAALKVGADKFGTLESYLDEQAGKSSEYAKAAKTATGETSAKTKAALNTAIPGFQTQLDERVTGARMTAQQRTAAAKEVIASLQRGAQVDPQILADLGITQEEFGKLANENKLRGDYANMIDPSTGKPYWEGSFDQNQFITEKNPENEITRSNFASAADYAKAAALAKLSGQDMSGFLNPNDIGQAGTASLDTVDFDKAGLSSSSGIILDRDKYLVGQSFGTQTPEDPNTWAGGLAYWNNVWSGKLNPPSPRSMAALEAAVRQGWWTPTSSRPTLGIGGPDKNPWGAY